MNKTITIRLSGNAAEISPDGKSVLQDEVREILEPELRYQHLKLIRGYKAFDFSGRRKPIREETKLLYIYDKYGRMVCGIGLVPRIIKLLKSINYDVNIVDVNPPHPRPDRYKEDWDNLLDNFSFRARQEELIVNISANTRGIIDAPTGFGKSFCYKAIGLLYPKANIAITTKRKDLVQSIRNDLSTVLPAIGQIGGGKRERSRITVVTADSLKHVNHDDIDILIGEEVHELAAETYAASLANFKRSRMYGFTATPTGRMDNADMRIESLFGPIIFRMTYQQALELGLVVPIRVMWLDVFIDPNPCHGMVDVPKRRHGLWRNDQRNSIIAQAARQFGDDEQVLIMVTTLEHAVYLKQYLPEFTLCYAEQSDTADYDRYVRNGLLSADEPIMTSHRRQSLRNAFTRGDLKKVIATDVWSTGVSFNALSVLIRADARGSTIMDTQIPGRVCRLNPATNKLEGLVIDCLDQFDPSFRNAALKRRRNYESKGWVQDMPRLSRRF